MISRMFAPTISYRLFDPMPLPRILRLHRRIRASRKILKIAVRTVAFARKIKKVPMNK